MIQLYSTIEEVTRHPTVMAASVSQPAFFGHQQSRSPIYTIFYDHILR